MRSPEYMVFRLECAEIGAKYGLASWTVGMACLLRNFRTGGQPQVLENQWPHVEIVTSSEDPVFLNLLVAEGGPLGLRVTQRVGHTEMAMLRVPFPSEPDAPLTEKHRPPLENAFTVRVETPPLYPPEAAAGLHRVAQRTARDILGRLGCPVRQRLRASRSRMYRSKLRLDKDRLDRRETGDIAEDIFGPGAASDPKLRKWVRDSRHRVRSQERVSS